MKLTVVHMEPSANRHLNLLGFRKLTEGTLGLINILAVLGSYNH